MRSRGGDAARRTRRRARLFAATAALAPLPAGAATVTLTVSGTASPWLAGMPAGTRDAYDPATVTSTAAVLAGLTLQPGAAIYVSASGSAAVSPISGSTGPDGSSIDIVTHVTQNGIAAMTGPAPGLGAVFLTAASPDQSAAPAGTTFSGSGLNYSSTSPLSKQVFFVGNGVNETTGLGQRIVAPAEATRLYFGIIDTGTWNNTGGYSVTVSTAMQWTNAAGGTWATTGNWSQPLTPTNVDAVEFNLANTYNVTLAAGATAYSVAVNSGNVTYSLARQTLTLTRGLSIGGTSTTPAKLLISNGTVAAASMTVSSFGMLAMELTGVGTAQIDKLVLSGTATLGGTLTVTKINGFEPHLGDSFDLIDAATFTGTFTSLQLPTLNDPTNHWDTSRLYTDGAITVANPEPASCSAWLIPIALLRRRRRPA
jgi:hypothetical protein